MTEILASIQRNIVWKSGSDKMSFSGRINFYTEHRTKTP